jgi:endonuclease/exonuclease/phosphatase family metal-dependent hydrolase
LRLVTWNCCRGPFEAKAGALAPLRPDIAILQEAPRPKEKDTLQRLWFGGGSRVGVAVLAFNGYTLERASRASDETDPVRAVRVNGTHELNLLAIWARADTKYIRGVYDRMLGQVRFARKRPTILAGDLNSNSIWDRPRRPMDHSRFVAWMRAKLGLVSAYHEHFGEAHGKESRPTYYFLWNKAKPFHIDYCFVPEAWRASVRSVEIGEYEDWAALSDHRPVTVELDVP